MHTYNAVILATVTHKVVSAGWEWTSVTLPEGHRVRLGCHGVHANCIKCITFVIDSSKGNLTTSKSFITIFFVCYGSLLRGKSEVCEAECKLDQAHIPFHMTTSKWMFFFWCWYLQGLTHLLLKPVRTVSIVKNMYEYHTHKWIDSKLGKNGSIILSCVLCSSSGG